MVVLILFDKMILDNISIFAANNETSVLFLMGQESSIEEDEKIYEFETEWMRKNRKKRLLKQRIEKEIRLQGELEINDDIIEVDGLIEHYNNLTLKTLYTIKFFLKQGEL